jgi:hypothetical protein
MFLTASALLAELFALASFLLAIAAVCPVVLAPV